MLDYEKEIMKERMKNVVALRNDIMNSSYQFKMQSYANRFNLPVRYVRLKVLSDPMFALNFIKDPAKQSFHEKKAASYLESQSNIKDFVNLPASGNEAIGLLSGMIHSYTDLKQNSSKKIKTLDFKFKIRFEDSWYDCYCSHKYTKGTGGAQDNQYHDLISFMENARQNTNPKMLFFAIADGDYYDFKDINGLSKIEKMNREFGNQKTIAANINNLVDLINNEFN
ncbi:TPA: hypothetical protein ACN35C_004725 [Vibrio parahaemolyticus]